MKKFEDKCKELARKYPNNQEFGAQVRKLIQTDNCCALPENHRKSGDKKICAECGKIIKNGQNNN